MNRIDEDIKKGSFHGLYLLYGEEDYLRRFHTDKLKKAVLADDASNMNLTVWKDDGFNFEAFSEQALTFPFFAEHRLLLVENCGLFKKGGTELAEFLPSVPAQTIMIFSEREVDARGKLFKYAKTNGVVQEFKRLSEAELSGWILRRFDKAGRKIQRSAMQLFLERVGNDMSQINLEMQKLIDYTEGKDAIRLEDVKVLTTVHVETKVFEMIDAISRREQSWALRMYDDLLLAKEPPIKILVMMGRQFERLCQIKELRENGLDQAAIAEKTGMKTFAVRKSLEQAARFSAEELRDAFRACVETDERIKTGKMRDAAAVETLIVAVTSAASGKG